MDYFVGLSGGPRGSHEPGVALIDLQGRLSWVLEEERFNRFKSSISCFPTSALNAAISCLHNNDSIIKAASPGVTYLDMHQRWPLYLDHNFRLQVPFKAFHHQLCHAASAYYSSPFNDALIICLDGLGDRSSGIIAIGDNENIMVKQYLPLSSSVGQFWSLICQYIGYDGLQDAYKTMGLAPYGKPIYDLNNIFSYQNGRLALADNYIQDKYDFVSKHPAEPVYSSTFPSFLTQSIRRRTFEGLSQVDFDIAASAQQHLEHVLLQYFTDLQQRFNAKNICFAGGVALNSHFTGLLDKSSIFEKIFIPPYASDSGLATGASQLLYAEVTGLRPQPIDSPYLGTEYSDSYIVELLDSVSVPYVQVSLEHVADLLFSGQILAFFQGRSECGPRALGARSILANPCIPGMKDLINKKIKYREKYRPFAPVVPSDSLHDYFNVNGAFCNFMSFAVQAKPLTSKLAPEVVHIDNTSRVQSAHPSTKISQLLYLFAKRSGVPILLNTSFNLKGEPNVETPKDALRTFFSSGLDHLYISNFLVSKSIPANV